MNKKVKSIDKKEDKISRCATYISNMGIGEETKITPMAKSIKMHVHSLRDLLDSWQVMTEAGKIEIIRDKKGKIKRIARIKDEKRDLNFKKEIRDNLTNLNNKIDELIEDNQEIKNILKKENV